MVSTRAAFAWMFVWSGCDLAPGADICVNGAVRRAGECVFPVDAGADEANASDAAGDAGAVPSSPDTSTDADVTPQCTMSSQCSDKLPVCTDDGACGACSGDPDCERFAKVAPRCGPAGACVECTSNEHCVNPEKPVCGTNNECVGPCTSERDCERSSAVAWSTPYCELGEGVCVGCIPGALELEQCEDQNPDDALAPPACNPVTKACTGAPRGSLDACQPCVSDTECIDGLACVLTKFGDEPHGSFCLKKDDGSTCPIGNSALRETTSVLGVTAFYCFPDEALTTCEAVANFQASCKSDADCGAASVDDGKCVPVGASGAKRCTYECDAPADCSAASSCFGPGPKYCQP